MPGDRLEVPIDGFVIDIVRGDLLVEIQTRNFSSIKKKLETLTKTHRVRLVHPMAKEKWVVRETLDGKSEIGRRRSPKKRHFVDVFEELVRIPELLLNNNFELELLLTREEEIRQKDGRGSWKRRGWSIVDRRLIEVVDTRMLRTDTDYLGFLPTELSTPFTTTELASTLGTTKNLARKVTYCLRKMKLISQIGKKGNAWLYAV